MPYILPPVKDEDYQHQQNWCWVQYATATKPAAFIYESWGGYDDPKYHMNAAQKKKWKDFKFPRNNFKSTVDAYKKKGYVVVEPDDILELYKNYVPKSYNAAVRAKHIIPNAKGSDAGTHWVTSDAPIDLIYDKTSVNSVYNQFLNSMTWGGKKPNNAWKSPASYFWGYGRPLDFKGWHYVIPQVYSYETPTVVLHNYQTGKVAVVTECEGDDDEAGYYAMGPVAFEWKLNPKLLAAMNKPVVKPKAPARKPTAKKPKAKPKAKKASAKKPVAKPKARPSPSQSAAATKVGVRKRGNDGSMWEVKKNKNGVHRWVRDSKSTKRAEDYWYWK